MNIKNLFFLITGMFLSSPTGAESYFALDYVETSFPARCYSWPDTVQDCSREEQGRRIAIGTMLKEVYRVEVGVFDSGKSLSAYELVLGARLFRVGSAYFTTHIGYSGWNTEVPQYNCIGCEAAKARGGSRLYGFGIEYHWITLGYDLIESVEYPSDSRRLDGQRQDVERLMLGLNIEF